MRSAYYLGIWAGCAAFSGCITVNSPLFPDPSPILVRPMTPPPASAPIPLEAPGAIVPRLSPPEPDVPMPAPATGRGGGRVRSLYAAG